MTTTKIDIDDYGRVIYNNFYLGRVAYIEHAAPLCYEITHFPEAWCAVSRYFATLEEAVSALIILDAARRKQAIINQLEDKIIEHCRNNAGDTAKQIALVLNEPLKVVKAVLDRLCPSGNERGGYYYIDDFENFNESAQALSLNLHLRAA